MYSKKVIIISEAGLFSRAATNMIQLANNYKSTIFIEYEDKRANAKSLLGVLSLALTKDCEITLTAEGVDEKEAVTKLVEFIKSGCISESDKNDVIKDKTVPGQN